MCHGLFITFEGLDGAGKTTQIRRIKGRLEAAGRRVVATREPGGTKAGDEIRSILLSPQSHLTAEAEVLLYAASRAQHVREVIVPSLEQGKIVLCDRFLDASLAYQGRGLGLGVDRVASVNEFATGGLSPHLTFLFDLPVEASRQRLQRSRSSNQPDRIERRSPEYFQAVRDCFLEIARQEPDRVIVVDAARPESVIEQEIWSFITNHIDLQP